MIFHVDHLIAWCSLYGRKPMDKKGNFRLCWSNPTSVPPAKLYTIKELVMMETYIDNFHTIIYVPEIKIYRSTFQMNKL